MARWRLARGAAARALARLEAGEGCGGEVLQALRRLGVEERTREVVVKRHAREERTSLGVEQLAALVFASGREEAAELLAFLEVSERLRGHGILAWRSLPRRVLEPRSAECERFLATWLALPEAKRRLLGDRRWRSLDLESLLVEVAEVAEAAEAAPRGSRGGRGRTAPAQRARQSRSDAAASSRRPVAAAAWR